MGYEAVALHLSEPKAALPRASFGRLSRKYLHGSPAPDVHLARHASVAHELGADSAETLTRVTMKTTTGTKIELMAAKYVPPRLHQRWVVVKCERGLVKMDLEAQRLEVCADDVHVSSSLRYPQRYTTQFMLFTEKLSRPDLHIEDALLLQALMKTLEIRQMGLESGIGSYIEDDIERLCVSSGLSQYLVHATMR